MEAKRQAVAALILLFSVPFGTASALETRGLIKAGFDFGGDTLQRVTFSDNTTETIKANDGFYVGGGFAFVPDSLNLEMHLTAAWKYTGVTASNGEITFTRFPIEALGFFIADPFRFGGGLVYHLNPTLKRSGAVSGSDVDYDNAPGMVLQVDYRISENIGAGLRYTFLEYEQGSRSIRANGAGVAISGAF